MKNLCLLAILLLGFKAYSNPFADKTDSIKVALKNGIGYINSNIESKDGFFLYPIIGLLKSQKNVPINLDAKVVYSFADSLLYKKIKPLVAISTPDSARAYPLEDIDSSDYITRLMYYCFNYPTVNNIKQIKYYTLKLYKIGGYESTHTYLSLFLLVKRNNGRKLKRIFNKYIKYTRLITRCLANSETTSTDLKIEAIAFLSEENCNLINSKQIDFILSKQLNDGSWCNLPLEGEQNKMHTTTLAVWALTNWIDYSDPH